MKKNIKDEKLSTVCIWSKRILPNFAAIVCRLSSQVLKKKLLGKIYDGFFLYSDCTVLLIKVQLLGSVGRKCEVSKYFGCFFLRYFEFFNCFAKDEREGKSTQFTHTDCVKYIRYYLHLCSGSFGLVFSALSSIEKGNRAMRIEAKVWTKKLC